MTIDELCGRANRLRNIASENPESENGILLLAMADLFQHLADWQQRVESVKLPPMFAKLMGM